MVLSDRLSKNIPTWNWEKHTNSCFPETIRKYIQFNITWLLSKTTISNPTHWFIGQQQPIKLIGFSLWPSICFTVMGWAVCRAMVSTGDYSKHRLWAASTRAPCPGTTPAPLPLSRPCSGRNRSALALIEPGGPTLEQRQCWITSCFTSLSF
jgi:hypothetical protein